MKFYRSYGKRILDLVYASVALILLSPVFLIVALLVRIKLGSPIIFRQTRPGRGERPFTLLKFRSMAEKRDAMGNLLPDSRRLGPTGDFLRQTSLDELPELINVLRGEMSLIGPRPLLVRYLPYFSSEERVRFTVRPGITGLAQVSGRNNISWDRRLQRDIQYVQSLSFVNDIEILCNTIFCVFRRDGYLVNENDIMLDLDEERKSRTGRRDNQRES
jgi:lipopolysaccharide/colanic/teichoic acid biosynthesis glycosyltransferase